MIRPAPRPRPVPRRGIPGFTLLLAVVFLFTAAPAANAQLVPGGVYAVQGARLVTAPERVIEQGTIVVRDGLIEAVGSGVEVPPDAVVVDGTDLIVYPGFIDAFSQAGLELPSRQEREPAANIAHRSALDWFDPGHQGLEEWREQGFTTALVARDDGVFSGRAALMNLLGEDVGSMTVEDPVIQVLTYSGQRGYPGTLMAVVAFQRQTLIDAQYHTMLNERYASAPRGMERPDHEPALEAMAAEAAGRAPFLVQVHAENDFKRLRSLCEEFGIRCWVAGAQEGYRVTDLLDEMDVPVIVSLDYPSIERVTGYWFDRAFKDLSDEEREALDDRDTAAVRGNAGTLLGQGITLALCTSGMRDIGQFLDHLRMAVEAGLPADEALRALTVTPARLFGVEEVLGTLEEGKVANLTVACGDLFTSPDAYVSHIFVDGRLERFQEPAPPSAGIPTPIAGVWELSITMEGQSEQVIMQLRRDGERVTGEITSPMGEIPVSGTYSQGLLSVEGQVPDMGPLSLTARVEGDRLSGSLSLGPMADLEVTGRKRPSVRRAGEGGPR
ncbi:MAG: amidohydrolase family protein [bacterium]